jgi:predicted glycogen debranching enzyme
MQAQVPLGEATEWLEADGLGGFAMGTTSGIRSRRYHSLLTAAQGPARYVLVNGLEAWVETPWGRLPISSHRYAPDIIHPDGASRIKSFEADPWPRWTFDLGNGCELVQEVLVPRGRNLCLLRWTLCGGAGEVSLHVRPLLSGRDFHALHRENGAFRTTAVLGGACVTWRPYDGLPPIAAASDGDYEHAPDWYRSFLYAEERARGLDDTEDLASPGIFRFRMEGGAAMLILTTDPAAVAALRAGPDVAAFAAELCWAEEKRRAAFGSRLLRAADAYLADWGPRKTIVAGYPWFGEWGRDTFIALRGLCIATGRLEEAREILTGWAATVSQGMVPNRFPEHGLEPEFNSADASLWYVLAVQELLQAWMRQRLSPLPDRELLERAALAVVAGYSEGTRYGIRADSDGLLMAGAPGVQLTWMDARVGDRVITPRTGKPVEVEALWLHALAFAATLDGAWRPLFRRGAAAFESRFWNERDRCLYDVVDAEHRPGVVDPTIRPNQLLAIGGLPMTLVSPERARAALDLVERRLWTPLGPRSLDPFDPAYVGRYQGGVVARDSAYHQGPVWPWLAGPFVEAWVRSRGSTRSAREEARRRFLEPLLAHLDAAGLGHVSEIADGDAPHTPRGCPFQAWSVGELLRIERVVAGHDTASTAAAS